MKLKTSLVIALLAVALSAVVAVAAPSADAKKTGSISTPAAGTTTSGLPVTGTFNITSFKKVNGVITAVGTFTGSIDGGTPVTNVGDVRRAGNQRHVGCQWRSSPDSRSGSRHLFDPRPDARAAAPRSAGLVVDLNQVHLQITAEQGSGNLLGNLLCAVAGLLDNTGTGGLSGILQSVVNLLNQILGQL